MNVYTDVNFADAPVDVKGGRLWVNAGGVREAATMALHRAAKDGWRGRIRVAAWTETMMQERAAYVMVADITPNSPEPRPTVPDPCGASQHDPKYLDQR